MNLESWFTVCRVERSWEGAGPESPGHEGPRHPGTQPLGATWGEESGEETPGLPESEDPGRGVSGERLQARASGQRDARLGEDTSRRWGPIGKRRGRNRAFRGDSREQGAGLPEGPQAGDIGRGVGPGPPEHRGGYREGLTPCARETSRVTADPPSHTHLSTAEEPPPGQAPLAPPAVASQIHRK